MDAIKYLIGFFFKLAFAALFIALVWWLVGLLFPTLSISQVKQLFVGDKKVEILPSPRAYSEALQSIKIPTATSSVYSHGKPFSGYTSYGGRTVYTNGSFVVYEPSVIPRDDIREDIPAEQNVAPARSVYIRNLSIYDGGTVYTGLSFTGEARKEMFKNGMFPILLLDARGAVVGVSRATELSTWSVPGWSRFEVKISHQVPSGGGPCALVFEQGRDQYSTRDPVRVGIRAKCN